MSHDARTTLLQRSRSTLESSDERIRRARQRVDDSRSLIRSISDAELWAPQTGADSPDSPQHQVQEIIERNSGLVEISRQLMDVARTLVSLSRERMAEVTRAIPRLPPPREQ